MKLFSQWFFVSLFLYCFSIKTLKARSIEVLAVRHAESMNNIISQSRDPFRYLKNITTQRHKLKASGEPLGKNPVLSGQGRTDARLAHSQMFPEENDIRNMFYGEEPYQAVFVSPLHRTMQTALLLFGPQIYKDNIPLRPLASISEYIRSPSEVPSNYENFNRLFDFEQEKWFREHNQVDMRAEQSYQKWQRDFLNTSQKLFSTVWWPTGEDLDGNTETPESLSRRLNKLKKDLESFEYDKVILVSHGTYLRTLFWGIEELEEEEHPLSNLAMIKAILNTETGEWSQLSCLNPETGATEALARCLRIK